MQDKMAENAWRLLGAAFSWRSPQFLDRVLPRDRVRADQARVGLSDTQLGLIGSAFTVVYAIAGVPLGRWPISLSQSDHRARARSLESFDRSDRSGMELHVVSADSPGRRHRGGQLYPAATSLIGDLFPSDKRSRAIGIFMLGLPIGLPGVLLDRAMVRPSGQTDGQPEHEDPDRARPLVDGNRSRSGMSPRGIAGLPMPTPRRISRNDV